MTNNFKLKIITREGLIFGNDVVSITAFNSKGRFDVLANHANMVSLIENEISIKLVNNTEKKFKLFAGMFQFINNEANIYLGFKK